MVRRPTTRTTRTTGQPAIGRPARRSAPAPRRLERPAPARAPEESRIASVVKAAYTVQDVAVLLSISDKTVKRLIQDGTLRAQKIGHDWRIPIAAFRAAFPGFVDSGR